MAVKAKTETFESVHAKSRIL